MSLEGLIAALDFGDELGDVIGLIDLLGLDLAAFLIIEATDETDFVEQPVGGVGGEVKNSILLANLCGDNSLSLLL